MARTRELTEDRVLSIMENGKRPVWTARALGDYAGVSRPTASKRLKELAVADRVETMDVGNATAYYLVGIETQPFSGENPIERDLIRSLEGRFVGLDYAPEHAAHPSRHPATAGDPVEAKVIGVPGDWSVDWVRFAGECDGCENTYCEAPKSELTDAEQWPTSVQALIRSTLEGKPSAPIRHKDLPEGFDIKSDPTLLTPSNDSVFLKDVTVEFLSGFGQGVERNTESDSSPAPRSVEELMEGSERKNYYPEHVEKWVREERAQEMADELLTTDE